MLDVAGGSTENGANIQQWGDNGSLAQRWVFEDAGNGYYYICCLGGQYMDAAGCVGGTVPVNDTNVQSWEFTGASNQMFRLEPNPSSTGSTLSEGSWWIIGVGAVVIVGVIAVIAVRKKARSA